MHRVVVERTHRGSKHDGVRRCTEPLREGALGERALPVQVSAQAVRHQRRQQRGGEGHRGNVGLRSLGDGPHVGEDLTRIRGATLSVRDRARVGSSVAVGHPRQLLHDGRFDGDVDRGGRHTGREVSQRRHLRAQSASGADRRLEHQSPRDAVSPAALRATIICVDEPSIRDRRMRARGSLLASASCS